MTVRQASRSQKKVTSYATKKYYVPRTAHSRVYYKLRAGEPIPSLLRYTRDKDELGKPVNDLIEVGSRIDDLQRIGKSLTLDSVGLKKFEPSKEKIEGTEELQKAIDRMCPVTDQVLRTIRERLIAMLEPFVNGNGKAK